MILQAILIAGAVFSSAALAHEAKLSDAEIAHIAYSAGVLDVTAGEQAAKKTTDPKIRAFAEQMVRDHKAVNEKALALVKKLDVTPQDNPTSQSLARAAAEKQEHLAKLTGAAYDTAYIQNEVAYHSTVNGALKDTLIPNANNAELKAFLQTGLALFKSHQTHAEQLAASRK